MRKVGGGKPLENLCHLPTDEPAIAIMTASSDEHYTKNLALLRKYIRTHPECVALKNFHSGYKNWENSTYLMGEITSEEWVEITTEAAVHPYDTHPSTFPVIPIDLPDEPEDL